VRKRGTIRAGLKASFVPLTFGFVCTMVVAIGCAFLGRPHTMASRHSKYHIGGALWAGFHSDRMGAHHFVFYSPERVMNPDVANPQVLSGPRWIAGTLDRRPRINWARLGCGWPQVCLVAGWDCLQTAGDPIPPPTDWGYLTVGATSRRMPDVRLYFDDKIPIRPSWFGLMWNIAFYAFAWLIAASMVRWLVRSKRARGERCVNCGYSRSGLAAGTPCPECGGVASGPSLLPSLSKSTESRA
jgi:hypothetical protein